MRIFPTGVSCFGLLLLGIPLRAQPGSADAERVLRAATRAMGGSALTAIATLETVAECRGPRTDYQTIVRSARDGRVAFEQDFPNGRNYRATLGPAGDWEYDPDSGRYVKASPLTKTEVHAHEIHMLAIAPESRLGSPLGVGDTVYRDTAAIAVRFRDGLGGTVSAYYRRSDTTLLGFSFPNHRDSGSAPIALVVGHWKRLAGVLLMTRAVYWQGRDAYRFRFTRIRLNTVPDAAFSRPTR